MFLVCLSQYYKFYLLTMKYYFKTITFAECLTKERIFFYLFILFEKFVFVCVCDVAFISFIHILCIECCFVALSVDADMK